MSALITQMILTLSLPVYTMMNKNNGPAALSGVTSEQKGLIRERFCTFQLCGGGGVYFVDQRLGGPRSALLLSAALTEAESGPSL